MLKLNINVNFDDCGCITTFKDVTGFSTSNGTDGKFIPEGNTLPSKDDFHFSDGVFLNAVHLKDYDDKIKVFEKDYPLPLTPADPTKVKPIYSENTITNLQSLYQDGEVHVGMYFIMTKSFYESRPTGWFDTNLPICYYDELEEVFYHLNDGGTEKLKTTQDVVTKVDAKGTQGIKYTERIIFSICHLKSCYSSMLTEYFDKVLGLDPVTGNRKCLSGNCNDADDYRMLKNNLDLLSKLIYSIEYLLDCSKYDDAMRLLKLIGSCGGICDKYNKQKSKNGCGC